MASPRGSYRNADPAPGEGDRHPAERRQGGEGRHHPGNEFEAMAGGEDEPRGIVKEPVLPDQRPNRLRHLRLGRDDQGRGAARPRALDRVPSASRRLEWKDYSATDHAFTLRRGECCSPSWRPLARSLALVFDAYPIQMCHPAQ